MVHKTLRLSVLFALAVAGVWGAQAQARATIGDLLTEEIKSKGLGGTVAVPKGADAELVGKTRKSRLLSAPVAARAIVTGVIVRFKDLGEQRLAAENLPPSNRAIAAVTSASNGGLVFQRAMSGGMHVFSAQIALSQTDADNIIAALTAASIIDLGEPDVIVTHEQSGSSDPYFRYQWNLLGPTENYFGGISANLVWPYSQGAANTVVAVVDTGVLPHPDFSDRLLQGYSFVTSEGRSANAADPGDWTIAGQCKPGTAAANSSWHGTHVTGIIAANGANGLGIAGISWRTKILPVRVLGKCGGQISDIIDGIHWAAGIVVPGVPKNPNPANIINLSLSGLAPGGCSLMYQESINRALGQGVLVVVAAGNKADDASRYTPANCKGVLTTMAVGPYGDLASYSNVSFTGGIAAPGGDTTLYGDFGGIWSTVASGAQSPGSYDYKPLQGTSMAAPHVSGVAALALAVNPNLSGAELAFVMEYAAMPFPQVSECSAFSVCGAGIVNAITTVAIAVALSDRTLVYEFYNTNANHFFRTASKLEWAAVNRGSAGPGWYDSGSYFYAWSQQSPGTLPVCRFYSAVANSHFYTLNPDECAIVKGYPSWHYEGISFYAKPTVGGQCGKDKPVYRAYNNRGAFSDQNHRFTTDFASYQAMIKLGWAGEGIAMCV